jgi:hypothetical protein
MVYTYAYGFVVILVAVGSSTNIKCRIHFFVISFCYIAEHYFGRRGDPHESNVHLQSNLAHKACFYFFTIGHGEIVVVLLFLETCTCILAIVEKTSTCTLVNCLKIVLFLPRSPVENA